MDELSAAIQGSMTFPVRTVRELVEAIALNKVEFDTAVIVVTRDGTGWQLDGVELMVDENERQIEFQLRVGPPDAP